jgi:hypothetical protein
MSVLLLLACTRSPETIDQAPPDTADSGVDARPAGPCPDAARIGDRDFETVQAAVDAAEPGANVTVCPGTWIEQVHIERDVILAGDDAVLDGTGGVALRIGPAAAVEVHDLVVTGGTQGGVEVAAAELRLYDVVIEGNQGESGGGLIAYNATLEFHGVEIRGNSAERGGGLSLINTWAELNDTVVRDNTAIEGGGMATQGLGGTVGCVVSGGMFQDNSATRGGGVFATGDNRIDADLHLHDAVIQGNTAELGGGVYEDTDYGSLLLDGVQVHDNAASDSGGGVYLTVGGFLNDTDVRGNSATLRGGGLGSWEGWGWWFMTGGALADNSAATGGGAWAADIGRVEWSEVDVGDNDPDTLASETLSETLSETWSGTVTVSCAGGVCE